jgi:hypothetical protein
MPKRNVSLSLDEGLLRRAERFRASPTETRTALIERLLEQAVLDAEDRAIDAQYERAYRDRPVTDRDRATTNALARAAFRSARSARPPKDGTPHATRRSRGERDGHGQAL